MLKVCVMAAVTAFLVLTTQAHAKDAPMQRFDAATVANYVKIADGRAERLRERAQFPDPVVTAQVRVLVSWGSGVDYQTSIAAFREGVGRWRVERVYNGGDLGGLSAACMVTGDDELISSEAGRRDLDALLARSCALRRDPIYAWRARATEGATASIRIRGKRAIRRRS